MKHFIACMYLAIFFLFSSFSMAEAESDLVKITDIWSIVDGQVYFTVDKANAMCGTNVFLLKVVDSNSGVTYSTLMAAAVANRKVKLNTWGDCNVPGWGSEVQGIKVYF